ncbi:hypothetical protein M378DRAFT_178965 [Amanita muscaria Koide BX008]|uniref:Uncharacterized protein n=1 Tax=Amanita muscaria (strain Koide BX008) TaxID=946122 RepID=A0A0C2X4D3_AMAMK|nr:hypothetical protein M378DRAFT_178965 [Amanita muscaria Koide BX008]
MHRLAGLQDDLSQDRVSPVDTSSAQELDDLTRRVPKVLGLLPDVMNRRQSTDPRHPAALEQMTKDLIGVLEKAKPSMLVSYSRSLCRHAPNTAQLQIRQSTLIGADEATKLELVKGTGYARFLKSIEIGVYA